jgi:nucleoside-diphosphate-sugar epimerase
MRMTTAVAGADGVVNAVGQYVERGSATFRPVHVEAAARVASAARRAGVKRLAHLSGCLCARARQRGNKVLPSVPFSEKSRASDRSRKCRL